MTLRHALVSLLAPALAALIAAAPLRAQDQGPDWGPLERPGIAVLMRHAIAPGTGDPPEFELGDCATQRNLDRAGRQQARAIGAALRERGFRPDRLLTSRWCRARETAELLDLGEVEPFPTLDSFFAGRGDRAGQTAALREFLAERPEDASTLLVTHQVNITALTDIFPRSGEALMIEVAPDGAVEVLGRAAVRP